MPPVIVPMVQVKVLGILAVKEMLVAVPLQIVAEPAVVTTGFGLTVTVATPHDPRHNGSVVLSPRTKYWVVEDGVTVMVVPVPTSVLPQLPVYHRHTSPLLREPEKMVNVAVLPEQMVWEFTVG